MEEWLQIHAINLEREPERIIHRFAPETHGWSRQRPSIWSRQRQWTCGRRAEPRP
jgi:hypothetical protein